MLLEVFGDSFLSYVGDLHEIFEEQPYWGHLLLILCSVICGTAVGLERESKDKPAGVRTLALICVGSTIFTLASILIAEDSLADRGRIAAQVVTGIGFLGAGVIIRERGTIVGLTTGATIWTVAAIGVTIGAGYAAAGIVLTLIVVVTLTIIRRIESRFFEPYSRRSFRLLYEPGRGKARARLLGILDRYQVPNKDWRIGEEEELEFMEVEHGASGRTHHLMLSEIAELPEVVEIRYSTGHSNGVEQPSSA
jgi:putative Mg2+ transporter-C (MgtC) family protein